MINLSLEMDAVTLISYDKEMLVVWCCFLPILAIYSMQMCIFDHISTPALKYHAIFEFTAPVFL